MTKRTSRTARTRTIVLVAGGALAILVAAGCWVGVRGAMAASELEAIDPLTKSLRTAVEERDVDEVIVLADQIGEHAAAAESLTGDPVWRIGELIPFAGPNLTAVRVTSAELNSLSSNVVAPLGDLALTLTSADAAEPGRIDVGALMEAQEPLRRAATALASSSAALGEVTTDGLIPRLARGVERLSTLVDEATGVVSSLESASGIVPELIGGSGPRTLLLMIQNNAELRTGGGITGSFVELRAEDGRLTITDQADSSDFTRPTTPIAPVPEPLTALYGDVVGRYVQNASMAADFTVTAELASAWWATRSGVVPDAVISIDPIVLKALVGITGSVRLADGTELVPDDFIYRLLVEPYLTLTPKEQTLFFTEVTTGMFTRLFSGGVDPVAWIEALVTPIEEGRVSLWSADPATQELIGTGPLGGPSARQQHVGQNGYAVYFNDATGGKLDSYMTTSISSGVADCRPDGLRETVVSVTLTSTVPADAAERFPQSMIGYGQSGVAPGDIGMIVAVSAPEGNFFGGVTKDGQPLTGKEGEDAGFPVNLVRVDLAPGATSTLEFRFLTDRTEDFTPAILHTPLLKSPDVETTRVACS